MGEAEADIFRNIIVIKSNIITYGGAADEKITANIRDEIETMWNEPKGITYLKKVPFLVIFQITAACCTSITDEVNVVFALK